MGGITSTGFHEKKFVFVNTPGRNTVETVSSNFPFAAIEILYLTVETKYFFFFFFKYSKMLLRIKYFSHNDQSNNVTTFKNIF